MGQLSCLSGTFTQSSTENLSAVEDRGEVAWEDFIPGRINWVGIMRYESVRTSFGSNCGTYEGDISNIESVVAQSTEFGILYVYVRVLYTFFDSLATGS